MDEFDNIKTLIEVFSHKSYLPIEYFKISNDILKQAIEDFRGDYLRWYPNDNSIIKNKLLLTPQLFSLLCYRISRMINLLNNSVLPPRLSIGADAFSLLGRQIGQIEIYYSADIGRSFKINHGVGSVIGARCKIGENCTIHQNCTIGDRKGGRPTIGNNVIIYAGSMILGDISIGDNCIIGANTVVTCDCPSNSVIVGTPGKIIKTI